MPFTLSRYIIYWLFEILSTATKIAGTKACVIFRVLGCYLSFLKHFRLNITWRFRGHHKNVFPETPESNKRPHRKKWICLIFGRAVFIHISCLLVAGISSSVFYTYASYSKRKLWKYIPCHNIQRTPMRCLQHKIK